MALQRAEQPDTRWAAVLAACTLAFVLAVIAASAHVRLGGAQVPAASADSIEAARTVRQSAGAGAALGVAALSIAAPAVRATRAALGVASIIALAMTVLLSLVGLATGIDPPPWAAYTNQFGGVVLAGVLGWLLGRASARLDAVGHGPLAAVALSFCVLQAAFGGALATLLRDPSVAFLILHAAVGLAAASCTAALAVALARCGARRPAMLLAACAATVPLIGVLCALAGSSAVLQVAHALGGAMLLACTTYAFARSGPRS